MAGGSTFQIHSDGGLVEVHEDGSTTRIQPLVGPKRDPALVPTDAAPVKARVVTKQRSARDIIRELKSRLSQVNREIRARKALEKERDQLMRLIQAAHGKGIAPVRELKRSAS